MSEEEMRLSSDSEDEAIQSVIDDDDDDVRYSLRSRTVPDTQITTISTTSAPVEVIAARSQEPTGPASRSIANGGNQLGNPARTTDVREAPHHDVRSGQAVTADLLPPVLQRNSPFELMPTRSTKARWPPVAPTYSGIDGQLTWSDPGSRRTQGMLPRVRLPFEFDKRDIPYVPHGTRTVDTRAPALAFATRMTAVEQTSLRRDDDRLLASGTIDELPWLRYHQLFNQRITEGERAMEALRGHAADTRDELDIHPDPHPPLDGGHITPYAGRLGPKSRQFGSERPAGAQTGTATDHRRRPDRGEFHTTIDW